ncbi:hypothetical protein M441DRAFT_366505 [Trichoderma asperellum CBS 433.97]|uniref:Uncharacterized protein n=1 Tax=Trichoderma asperellum (strain ATCC 204424 / CBS 433.97 / NBRC 101777) TaxID=1042311 RepID=A0A2T3ZEB1_TRIA4|nr:hypothetical protein M441DRAFT_366505 [Trichoderma asperellum CBS 433.97]PTB43148.1 hypothetical protein M441DRAFT_366505 [Trichoderma asperellum CBS 433.97]
MGSVLSPNRCFIMPCKSCYFFLVQIIYKGKKKRRPLNSHTIFYIYPILYIIHFCAQRR